MDWLLHLISPLVSILIAIATDPHVHILVNLLSALIVAAKFIPSLRIFGLISSVGVVLLEITQYWLKTDPKGKKLAKQSQIDEKVASHIDKYVGYSNLEEGLEPV